MLATADSSRRRTIHYHTDCAWFAGCENMLVSFCSSTAMRAEFSISFSFRDSARYRAGVRARMPEDLRLHAMTFPDPSSVLRTPQRPRMLRRLVRFLSRVLFTVPLLVYEVAKLTLLFRRVAANLVHINNGGYPAALSARAAVLAARLAGIPSVMVVNNLAVGYDHPGRLFGYALDRMVAGSVSCFVTGSVAAAARLQEVLRLPAKRCRPIPNGISMRQRGESEARTRQRLGLQEYDGVVFAVIAVLEPRKGHRVLLQSVLELRNRAPASLSNIKVLIEGDGQLAKELRQFIQDSGLENHCVLLGREANIMDLLGIIDVLLTPSVDYEDFPNVILEAMGAGKAVIASRLAGIPEQVVDGETGLLVTPGRSDELADAMQRLCSDRDLTCRMGRAGLERFRARFTAETAVGRYIELYRSLLEAQ
jgi:glycosyltransferase involved in cell wall biosynthesis